MRGLTIAPLTIDDCRGGRGFSIVNRQSPHRQFRRRGGMLLESVTLVPILVLLFVGAMEMGKIALTYYQLHKALRGAGRMVGVLQGADFCNGDDPQITAVKNFIVFGPGGDTASPLVRDLTPDRILITPERSADDGTIGDCDCGGTDGCSLSDGGRPPDFVRLSIDGGYPFQPHIPFRVLETILLRPHVRVPFGGQ